MAKETVIVTGASGYIAAHVCLAFLTNSYRVVGTVRSEDKGRYLTDLFKDFGDAFRYSVVPDMQKEGAFDEAAKGCQDPHAQLVTPAVLGTTHALLAAQTAGVRRVVVTSSFAAIGRASQSLPYTYTEKDWNTDSLELAVPTYQTSKTRAEKAAWEFVEGRRPGFDLVTMNPPLVVGPTIHSTSVTSLNTSMNYLLRYVSGYHKVPQAGGIGYVHVKDLALAHVRAFERPEAGGQRFLVGEGTHTWQELCDVIRAEFPELRSTVPEGTPGQYVPQAVLDNTKARTTLGIEFVDFKTMVKESVVDCLEILKKGGHAVGAGADAGDV
ncbi:methylglyoxal reductase (NADPH-dependent) gre2 [Gonapodya sp. JEL0774]|nr:methylglyoxal reductase (NADPH-dependent) gre2 [Gonapodya sp. JEL0774]